MIVKLKKGYNRSIRKTEGRSISRSAALQRKMDEAKEMFKSVFHKIKSEDGLHTACMLGQRNIGSVVDLRQFSRLKLSCSSNEPSVLHQILANKLCVSYSHWPHPVASPHRSSPPLFFISLNYV